MDDDSILAPDRHFKNLQRVFGLSATLHDLAVANISRDETAEQLIKEQQLLAEAKQKRADRKKLIDTTHRYVIDVIANLLVVSADDLIEGIIDDQRHIELFQNFFEENGSNAFFLFYDNFEYVSKGN